MRTITDGLPGVAKQALSTNCAKSTPYIFIFRSPALLGGGRSLKIELTPRLLLIVLLLNTTELLTPILENHVFSNKSIQASGLTVTKVRIIRLYCLRLKEDDIQPQLWPLTCYSCYDVTPVIECNTVVKRPPFKRLD